ncbi:hypothetical protein ACIA5D_13100 [Actinoplanes sp. NPDC051513]|uniref:hypothetical protein n=1 Tax=Actinoplanes sp. NPDC051513 TaxID=3363908 RepID=UPI0037B93C2C
MTTTKITRPDLDSLSSKIATLDLTEREQSVLLAIFAIAADSLGREVTDTKVKRATPGVTITQVGELPDLTTIFDKAFTAALTGGDDGSEEVVAVSLGKIGR